MNLADRFFLHLIGVVILLAPILEINAQEIDYFPIQKRDGLTSNFVYDIELDSNNLVWIATNNGLDMYNGRSISHYTIEDGLATNFITTLKYAPTGELWIGHHTGKVSKFDGIDFVNYNIGSEDRIISIIPLDDPSTAIAQDNSGNFFYIFQDTLMPMFTEEGSRPKKLVNAGSSQFYAIYEDRISRLDPNTWKLTQLLNMNIKASGKTGTDGEIYILSSDAILLQNESELKILKQFESQSDFINQLTNGHWMNDGNIWSTSSDSLFHFYFDGISIKKKNAYSVKSATGLRQVTSIKQSDNHLILSTKSNGIFEVPLPESYYLTSDLSDPDKAIVVISELELLVGEGKSVLHLLRSSLKENHWYIKRSRDFKTDITAIHKVDSDQSVVGTKNGTVFSISNSSFKATRIANVPDQITHISADKQMNLWVSTLTNGVFVLTWDGSKKAHYDTSNKLSHNYIKEVFHDANDGIWFLSEKTKLTYFKGEETNYFGRDHGLTNLDFTSIEEDGQNRIWISTEDGQLLLFKDSTFIQLPFGLKPNKARVMKLIHHDTNMIAIANNGIYWIDERSGRAKAHRPLYQSKVISEFQNGMTHNDSSIIIANDGFIWFVPKKAPKTNISSTPWVTSWRLDGKVLADLNNVDVSSIRTLQAHIESYQINEDRPYWYRIIGIDTNWIGPSNNPVVTFTNLTYGDYRFEIGLGSNESAPKHYESYSFTVQTPFYAYPWFYIIVLVVLGLLVRLIVALRTRQLRMERAKLELQVRSRTAKIEDQRKLIELKNEEILASINYASRIQSAILPPSEKIDQCFKEHFVLYLPKDIVAGDFYWMHEQKTEDQHLVYIAAADCTGHGVPGALVSVICSTALNRAVVEFQCKTAAAVLDKTRDLVIERLTQGLTSVSDGMDIALCVFDMKAQTLNFAGANNPLCIVSSNPDITTSSTEVTDSEAKFFHEIKADKQPIGSYALMTPFKNHVVDVKSGDTIYMFSDGYLDQFGGPNGKKLRSKTFKAQLQKVSQLSLEQQGIELEAFFNDWKQSQEQIDDVCVIGIKIP